MSHSRMTKLGKLGGYLDDDLIKRNILGNIGNLFVKCMR